MPSSSSKKETNKGRYPKRHNGRNRKAKKKARKEKQDDSLYSTTNLQDDIEAQLQRQRQKQRLQQQQQEAVPQTEIETSTSTTATIRNADVLGNYRYDPKRKAYFHKNDDIFKHDKKQNIAPNAKKEQQNFDARSFMYHCRNPYSTPIAPRLLYAMETCQFTSNRRRIRSYCTAQHLFDTFQIIPSMISEDNHGGNNSRTNEGLDAIGEGLSRRRWHTMLDPYNCEEPIVRRPRANPHHHFWDLTCKTRVPPSAKTFDVAPGLDDQKMPAMVTLMEGGALLRPQVDPKSTTLIGDHANPALSSCTYISANPIDDSDQLLREEQELDVVKFQSEKEFENENFIFGALSGGTTPNETIFHLFHKTQHSLSCLPHAANDFSLKLDSSSDVGALVFAPRRTRESFLAPYSYCFENDTFVKYKCRNFPQSDVLCIEHQQMTSTNEFFCGHRNGEVSLVDPRTRNGPCIIGKSDFALSSSSKGTKKCNNIGNFGSTTKILTTAGEKLIITKGSLGSCRLYDIRKVGSHDRYSSDVVWDFTVPSDLLHPSLSSCCSGLAVDPTSSVVLSPFVNRRKDPCLGVWSLSTGDFIGSRSISPTGGSNVEGLPYCELSSTITDAYEISTTDYETKRKSDMFGLWFKCGSLVPQAPAALGSIHHIMMPGKKTCLLNGDEEQNKDGDELTTR